MPQAIETRLLFRNDARTPLGRLTMAGFIHNSAGVGGAAMRVLGSYAIVLLLEGSGRYQYGPGAGEYWNEFYVVFDGPVFDMWRQVGLLNPAQPIQPIRP